MGPAENNAIRWRGEVSRSAPAAKSDLVSRSAASAVRQASPPSNGKTLRPARSIRPPSGLQAGDVIVERGHLQCDRLGLGSRTTRSRPRQQRPRPGTRAIGYLAVHQRPSRSEILAAGLVPPIGELLAETHGVNCAFRRAPISISASRRAFMFFLRQACELASSSQSQFGATTTTVVIVDSWQGVSVARDDLPQPVKASRRSRGSLRRPQQRQRRARSFLLCHASAATLLFAGGARSPATSHPTSP